MDRSNEQGAKSKANDLPGLIMRSTLEMTDIKARKSIFQTAQLLYKNVQYLLMNSNYHLVMQKIVLHKIFGYSDFRQMQREAIETIIASKDSLVLLPTGSGKTVKILRSPVLRGEWDGGSETARKLRGIGKKETKKANLLC
ncbi:Hypothetical predicted protein [Paramuricea clavata]|uniref:Uncharacterized protein n=1 Tax=Paramuricea clavata TaxID=317549 RepID=A0A6S7FRZ0_PARCT|nr:Hypothetical predicted protein [Paramuricea clavata]